MGYQIKSVKIQIDKEITFRND